MPIDSVPISLAMLPRIVAGPMVRRLTRTEVSVWVATVDPAQVTLRVREHATSGPPASVVSATPTKVKSHLWMTVLTAPAPGGGTFVPGRVYEYDLDASCSGRRSLTR